MSDWVQFGLLVLSFPHSGLLVLSFVVCCCLAVSSWFWRKARQKVRRLERELADLERNNETVGKMFHSGWQVHEEMHTGAGGLTIEGELEQQNAALRRELSWLRDNALEERTALLVALHSWRELADLELEQTGHFIQRPAAVTVTAHGTYGERGQGPALAVHR